MVDGAISVSPPQKLDTLVKQAQFDRQVFFLFPVVFSFPRKCHKNMASNGLSAPTAATNPASTSQPLDGG